MPELIAYHEAGHPLVLCWYAFRAHWPQDKEEAIGEILAHELVSGSSVLLPWSTAETDRGQLPMPPRRDS